jgi:hypothetical protein
MSVRRLSSIVVLAALCVARPFAGPLLPESVSAGSSALEPCPSVSFGPVSAFPGGIAGNPYGPVALTGTGGDAPYTFAITSGALPDGLALSSAGSLSGTPVSLGGYSFTVRVTDANGCTGSQHLGVTINNSAFSTSANVIDAHISRTIVLGTGNPADDATPAGTLMTGRRSWGFSLKNHDPAMTFTNPSIHIVSNIAGGAGLLMPPWSPITFPLDLPLTRPALNPSSSPDGSDMYMTGISDDVTPRTGTPGFDSTRSVTPLVVPPGGGLQTVTVTMKLVDPRYVSQSPNFNINMGGDCQSVVAPANLDQGEQAFSNCNAFGVFAAVNNAQLHKTYAFSFVIHTPNPGSSPVAAKGWLSVQSNIGGIPGIVLGSSVSMNDNLLDGGAVFSVDQGAEFHPVFLDSFIVQYAGMYEEVTSATVPTATTLVSSPNPSSAGELVTLTASVAATGFGGTPTGTVTFLDGADVIGSAAVNASGDAVITTSTLAMGEHTLTATYSGEGVFIESASAPVNHLVYASLEGSGSFVIGDMNAVVGARVTFWGAQWAKQNSLTGGDAPSSFKGFANSTASSSWSTDPGNSSQPPSSVPTYMAVIVSSAISKSGSTISGNTVRLAIVRTDAGYAGNPGHPGTGTIIGLR